MCHALPPTWLAVSAQVGRLLMFARTVVWAASVGNRPLMRALKEPLMFHGIIRNDSVTSAQLAHWVERQIELKGGACLVLAFMN